MAGEGAAMTAPPLRDYQDRCLALVRERWDAGVRRVCVVAPTGAGKTRIGVALPGLATAEHTLWIAHRIELLGQAAARLREVGLDVGIISPQHQPDPWARVQVASVDTLIARGSRPRADLVIWDEAHHAAAETYRTVLASYPGALHAGLTATPQRRDGKPLTEHYDALVVAAQYSELLAAGHLVSCRVFRPSELLSGGDLAREPLDAWQRHADGQPTFAFASTVALARKYAEQFADAGIRTAVIDGQMADRERAEILAQFRARELDVLWNVYVLTEGIDVPHASVCLLARGVSHAGPYLQIVGRVLRPAPGKDGARLIDLSGCSHVHGLPTADREYALDGRAIAVTGEALKNCPQCGACVPAAAATCNDCGYAWPREARRRPRIWDLELAEAIEAAGGDPAAVGDEHRWRECQRLVRLCADRGFGLYFARKEFEKLFGAAPPADWIRRASTPMQRVRERARLEQVARERGYKSGWVRYRYAAIFGGG
jgi:DNA repair protein RadD